MLKTGLFAARAWAWLQAQHGLLVSRGARRWRRRALDESDGFVGRQVVEDRKFVTADRGRAEPTVLALDAVVVSLDRLPAHDFEVGIRSRSAEPGAEHVEACGEETGALRRPSRQRRRCLHPGAGTAAASHPLLGGVHQRHRPVAGSSCA